jgi:hypothetical protein
MSCKKYHNKGVTAKYVQTNELAPKVFRGRFVSIYYQYSDNSIGN